jgi:LysR family transcriptional regulator, cys regulon transcriptional activator
MKLQQLKYLLAIVDNGLNITAAAERMYTSQPGVSKQLKLLEEELGLQLFSRKGKSLNEITAAGEKVIDRARVIMGEVENIRSLANAYYQEEEGTLSIAATHTQARYVLPPVIQRFRERYPKVSLNLHQGTSEQIADMLASRDIDFAIVTGSDELFGNLLLIPAYRWDRKVLVRHDHELARLDQDLSLQELAKHPLVSYVFSFNGEYSLKKVFSEHGLRPDVVFTARDADVIKTCVRMGLGVGIIASMAISPADSADLTVLDASGLFPRNTTWVGFRKNLPMRRYMSDFLLLFAPHISDSQLRAAVLAQHQQDVDTIFANSRLPLRNGPGDSLSVAA